MTGEKQLSASDGGMCALGLLQNHVPTQRKPALEASAHRPPKRLRNTTRTLIALLLQPALPLEFLAMCTNMSWIYYYLQP